MDKQFIGKTISVFIPVIFYLISASYSSEQNHDIVITIRIRGVSESNLTLLGRSGSGIFKSFKEIQSIPASEIGRMVIPSEFLPGEFIVRFDYKEKATSTPYPCEKNIFINDQDMELWVNPAYCNNPDSSWFQKDERENTAFAKFSEENSVRKEKLGLLQNFLLNYDDPGSAFYQQRIREYEKRRQVYNQWITSCIQRDSSLFVSKIYRFEYVPEISWKGSEADRTKSIIDHYLDDMDFSSPLIIRTSDMKRWMDIYVNFYGQLASSITLRDSLFALAGTTAIEKARKGNSLVYGWMVDYFYRGYESNGITAGMKILEPYLNDSECLTTKRFEIKKRLEGMEKLIPGVKAPDISMKDSNGDPFDLYSWVPSGKFILLLFWSAGCSHCVEIIKELYLWQQ